MQGKHLNLCTISLAWILILLIQELRTHITALPSGVNKRRYDPKVSFIKMNAVTVMMIVFVLSWKHV